MQPEIIRRLNELTIQFYQHHAPSFSASRSSAWAGWHELLPFFTTTGPVSVLDVGCGNGRFAQFLEQNRINYHYLGIDQSTKLIQIAQKQVKNCQFMVEDCTTITNCLQKNEYSHIVVFGVLHHVPDQVKRLELLKKLASLSTENGYIFASFWQPLKAGDRFIKKQLSSEKFHIQPTELEDGDLLLGWENSHDYARYCHSFSDQEIDWYIAQLSKKLSLVQRFSADGKTSNLNQYVVWQNKGEPAN